MLCAFVCVCVYKNTENDAKKKKCETSLLYTQHNNISKYFIQDIQMCI